jgi:hypothetical protein
MKLTRYYISFLCIIFLFAGTALSNAENIDYTQIPLEIPKTAADNKVISSADLQVLNSDILVEKYEDAAQPLNEFAKQTRIYKIKINKLTREKELLEKKLYTLQSERDHLNQDNMDKAEMIGELEFKLEKDDYAMKTLIRHILEKNRQLKLIYPDDFNPADQAVKRGEVKDLGNNVYIVDGRLAYVSEEILGQSMELTKSRHSHLLTMDEYIGLNNAADEYRQHVNFREIIIDQNYITARSLKKELEKTEDDYYRAQDQLDHLLYGF